MAARIAVRYVSRRFSSSGKILSEEEKAAENIYIKKVEQEKLEKLARKGPKPEDKAATSSGGSGTGTVSDPKPTGSVSDAAKSSGSTSSTSGVSTDKYRNYAVLTGVVTSLGALGWYLLSREKKSEEIQD